MLSIKQTENSLILEDYQNKVKNLSFFDILWRLEEDGINFRTINDQFHFIYNGKLYHCPDEGIKQLEQENYIELQEAKK
jgi:hypothetical protein